MSLEGSTNLERKHLAQTKTHRSVILERVNKKLLGIMGGIICLGLAAEAGPRRITLYPVDVAVSFSAQPEPNTDNCHLTINRTEPAEVLEENETQMRVRLDSNDFAGCSLRGTPVKEGWIIKKENAYGDDDPRPVKINRPQIPRVVIYTPKPCPKIAPPVLPEIAQSREIRKMTENGMKDYDENDRWMQCYPKNQKGLQTYKRVSPFMDRIVSNFTFSKAGQTYTVDPILFKCLIRRESGYDPKIKSDTGAMGLGQQTNINIRSIKHRLEVPGSWEGKLWKRIFEEAKNSPEGQEMLKECQRTSRGEDPVFQSKEDAACPLQSLAASGIYNLQIQESLRLSSKVKKVDLKQQLKYQLAVGAAYNLGHGAAGSAVNDLVVDGWLEAIVNKAKGAKRKEVSNHIEALRNCVEAGSFKPMYETDPMEKAPMCTAQKENGKS